MKTINLEEILDNNIPQSLKVEGYHFGDVNIANGEHIKFRLKRKKEIQEFLKY